MTDEEKFRFDLSGFLVRPAILERDEVKAAIVEQIERIHQRTRVFTARTPRRSRWSCECPDRPPQSARCLARNHRTRCPVRELFLRLA